MMKKHIKAMRKHIIVVYSGAESVKKPKKNVKKCKKNIAICKISIYNESTSRHVTKMGLCNIDPDSFSAINVKELTPDSFPKAETDSGVTFCFYCVNGEKNKEEKFSVQEKQKKWTSKAAGDNNEPVKESRKRMANVRDAANYFVRLYYHDNRECTSASVQKLLFIAQLRSLYLYKRPLFEDDFLIKPLCFSIPLVSNTYPDVILGGETLADSFSGIKLNIKPDFSVKEENLSGLYDITDGLFEEEKELMNSVYCGFGIYSGACIGKFMRELSIHTEDRYGKEITTDELLNYITGSVSLSTEDLENPIIKFARSQK